MCDSVSATKSLVRCELVLGVTVKLPRVSNHFTFSADYSYPTLWAVADAGSDWRYKILTRLVWPAICGAQCTIVS